MENSSSKNILQRIFTKTSDSQPQLLRYKILLPPSDTSDHVQLGFPKPIMYYLKKNPNPKLLFQLMKSSKYFCPKEFPFFVIDGLLFNGRQWLSSVGHVMKPLNFNAISKPLWIKGGIYCKSFENSKALSKILSRTAFCDIKALEIRNQILSFNEFKFLISTNQLTTFYFYNSHVKYSNGNIVTIDEIVKCLPNVKFLRWNFDKMTSLTINSETTIKFIENLNPSILKEIQIKHIPGTFDFNSFAKFMLKNYSIRFIIVFDSRISKKKLKQFQKFAVQVASILRVKFNNLKEK